VFYRLLAANSQFLHLPISQIIFKLKFPVLLPDFKGGRVKMLWLHRCFRFWDACNLKKKSDLIGFDMVLLDEKITPHFAGYVDVRKDPLLLLANMTVLRNSRLTHSLCLIATSSIHPHMHFHSRMTNDLTPIRGRYARYVELSVDPNPVVKRNGDDNTNRFDIASFIDAPPVLLEPQPPLSHLVVAAVDATTNDEKVQVVRRLAPPKHYNYGEYERPTNCPYAFAVFSSSH
ncbi:unnamed protein product, partial [Brassica oleracea var. botrytis]